MREETKGIRTIGRQLARNLTEAELELVAAGMMMLNTGGSHGQDDHSPTGNPCSDCD